MLGRFWRWPALLLALAAALRPAAEAPWRPLPWQGRAAFGTLAVSSRCASGPDGSWTAELLLENRGGAPVALDTLRAAMVRDGETIPAEIDLSAVRLPPGQRRKCWLRFPVPPGRGAVLQVRLPPAAPQ